MKNLGTMTNWRLYEKGTTNYALPTDAPLHLVGKVTDHPTFEDDTCVRSVTVKSADLQKQEVITNKGLYQLFTINDEYAEWLHEHNYTYPVINLDSVTKDMETSS